MSFGYSVGDVIAVGTLAWKVYVSCKDAPISFGRISSEVLSLHAVLKEVKGAIKIEPLPPERQQNLATIIQGCSGVLEELQVLVVKYERMNTQSQRTWDRMRYGFEDITELRARVTSNVTMLTAFMSMSRLFVERKLNKLREEFQNGHRQGSAVSEATVDSLTMDDREAWRAIRKELEDIGISIAAFEANRTFIVKWLQNAIDTNAFEEVSGVEGNAPGVPETSSQLEPEEEELSSPNRVTTHSIKITNVSKAEFPEGVTVDGTDIVHSFSRRSSVSRFTASTSNESVDSPRAKGDVKQTKLRNEGTQDPHLYLSIEELATASPSSTISRSITQSRRRPTKINSIIAKMLRYDQQLDEAYKSRYRALAESLLDKGADIDTLLRGGALTRAVMEDDLGDARWLLANGIGFGGHELDSAAETGHVDMMLLLIEHGFLINRTSDERCHLLTLASINGQLRALETLIQSGIAVDQANRLEQTALHQAAALGRQEAIKLLTSKGARIFLKDLQGVTPLHQAAYSGSVDAMRQLIEKGADIKQTDNFQNTPLHYAATAKFLPVVEFLVDSGSDVNHENLAGETALWIALRLEDDKTASKLVKLGTQLDRIVPILPYSPFMGLSSLRKPRENNANLNGTYLHMAAEYRCYDAVQEMLRRGMNPFALLNWEGVTPQRHAIDNEDWQMIRMFDEARIDK